MINVYYSPTNLSYYQVLKFLNKEEINYTKKRVEALSVEEIKTILIRNWNLNEILKKNFLNDNNLTKLKFNQLLELIIKNPRILKTPIIIDNINNFFLIGYNANDIEILLRSKN